MKKESTSLSNEEIKSDDSTPTGVADGHPATEISAPLRPEPSTGNLEMAPSTGKSWLQKSLGWIAAVLVSLIVGAALVIFLLYLPADRAMRQAQSDLASAQNELEVITAKMEGLESSLTGVTDQLDSAEASLESANLNLVVARLQANIAYARVALLSKDTLTARQELSDADANLAELTLLLDDSETTSALADRLKTIRASLTSDSSKALNEMRTLGENLSRLENR